MKRRGAERARARKGSPDNALTAATSNVIAAMRAHSVERLVVLGPPSMGDPQDRPGFLYHLVRALLPIMMRSLTRDHRAQARLIEESGLAWTIVRGAPAFTDGPYSGRYQGGPMTHDAGLRISRADLADLMLASATNSRFARSRPLVSQ